MHTHINQLLVQNMPKAAVDILKKKIKGKKIPTTTHILKSDTGSVESHCIVDRLSC